MPIVEIEGLGKVELGDEFLKLSADQQDATIQEIAAARPRVSPGEYAADVAKSAGIGLVRGAISVPGMIGDLSSVIADFTSMAGNKIAGAMGYPPSELPDRSKTVNAYVPTSADIQKAVEGVIGTEFYKPKTRGGEFSQSVAELAPTALLGPGGVARNLAAFAVAPGVASEAAGGLVKGTSLEAPVKIAAGLAAGGLAGAMTAPGNAANAVRGAASNVTREQLAQAETLFQEALAAGIPLTRPEAIQAITQGASNFGNLQRVVEGQGGMRDFFAQRAPRNEVAAGRVFDSVTPASPNPSVIGPAVGAAAEGTINEVRQGINATASPYYRAAEAVRLTPDEMARVRSLPGVPEAMRAVRGDTQLNRYVAHLPDDSIGFMDEVRKYLKAAADNASAPVNQQRNMQRSAGYGQDARDVRDTLRDVSLRAPGDPYGLALEIEKRGRREILQPLLDGPLGKLASRDHDTRKALNVLFPSNPIPNSAGEIFNAVRDIARKNPDAARNAVRAHLEMTFNEATRNLAGGVNSYGGAKFAAVLRGNPQQAANLQAAIRALPGGDRVWPGVERFLSILEAQGTRQPIGSQTAFNQEVLQDLRQGKMISEVGSAVASAGLKLPSKIKDRIERWRMGSSVDELADLFTRPDAGREFARMAGLNNSGQIIGAIIRIIGLAKPSEASANK